MKMKLHLSLKSDAIFGRGDGVAGLIDSEVEHDEYGLPFLRGRTLKGLLVEECANVLFTLGQAGSPMSEPFEKAALLLFGRPGSTDEDSARMHVGPARLPDELREVIRIEVESRRLTREDVLESLTAIRRQTSVNDETGAPEPTSLRSLRVVLRETALVSQLHLREDPTPDMEALLVVCAMSLRRAGTGRNRGRGRLIARVNDEEFHRSRWAYFKDKVNGAVL